MLQAGGISFLQAFAGYARNTLKALEMVHLAEFLVAFPSSHVFPILIAIFSAPGGWIAFGATASLMLGRFATKVHVGPR